ncbi:hypothetical protein FOL47_002426, partial [Perkinsus chesapeaki]
VKLAATMLKSTLTGLKSVLHQLVAVARVRKDEELASLSVLAYHLLARVPSELLVMQRRNIYVTNENFLQVWFAFLWKCDTWEGTEHHRRWSIARVLLPLTSIMLAACPNAHYCLATEHGPFDHGCELGVILTAGG